MLVIYAVLLNQDQEHMPGDFRLAITASTE